MRLTLRTLLAWMDDTLPPSRVREIGNQVAESPFAQELVEKIRRVTRQRRLTVPKSSGTESLDPNLVASYLDNDLDPEQVAEVETQCLNSDVCLAEVASGHQILSLLGQRAKVPTEVKERMYQLVKGREATHASSHEPKEALGARRIPSIPIQPWLERETASRSQRERYTLLAGCLVSFVVLGASAWYGLSTSPATPGPRLKPATDVVAAVEPAAEDETEAANLVATSEENAVPPKSVSPLTTEIPRPAPADGSAAATPVPNAAEAAKGQTPSAAPTAASLPPGAVGTAEKGDNILLRYNDEKREWERLAGAAVLNPSDRIVCLAPFRATLNLASVGLMMMGGSEIRLTAQAAGGPSRFDPRKGRFKLSKNPQGGTFAIDLGPQKSLTIDLANTGTVGVERLARRTFGQSTNLPATWAIYCAEGTLNLSQGGEKKAFDAPAVVIVNAAGTIEHHAGESPPPWVNEAVQPPAERELGDQFLRCFHPGRPILAEVVTATEESQETIRTLAISALITLGDLSYVMPLLDRKDAPEIRKEAIVALRDFISLGAESTRQAREQILEEFGETTGPIVEKMVIGYTPEEAAQPGILRTLVGYLGPETPSVGVRELSLDNLMKLSGKDSLGYNADQPEGGGLTNWKKLLGEGKILPDAKKPAE